MSAVKAIPVIPNRCSVRYSSDQSSGVSTLGPFVQEFVEKYRQLCKPDDVHVCNGSKEENDRMLNQLVERGRLVNLTKYDNW